MIRNALLLALVFGSSLSVADDFRLSLNHVTLVVSDFEASKKFYTETLGLEQIDTPWLPERQMFLALDDGLELHIGEVDGVDIKPSGFNHIAISLKEFDAFLAYLKSAGIVYTSLGGGEDYFVVERPDNVRQTYIADPDGYWIEINDID